MKQEPMSQSKLKQLFKLLKEWEQQFAPDSNREYNQPDEAQPYYGEVIQLVQTQVKREID